MGALLVQISAFSFAPNCQIIVSTRTEMVLEYNGVFVSEDINTLVLKNVSITSAMLNFQKNMFGTGLGQYKENIDTVIINKNYIISCNKK